MKHALALISLFISFAAVAGDALIVDVPVPSADGDIVVKFNKNSGKPMPVIDDRVEILGANISFEPRPNDSTKIYWGWTFTARFKPGQVPVSIMVEDESHKPTSVEFDTQEPHVRDGLWAGIAATQPLSKQFVAFVDTGKPMFNVHRITIKYADGTVSTLHQPSLHDSASLTAMLRSTVALLPALDKK